MEKHNAVRLPPTGIDNFGFEADCWIGYSEGGFPRGRAIGPYTKRNLEGFGIVYSAVPVRSAAKCESKAASLSDSPKHSQAVFGDRSFSVYKTGEGGMSQNIEGNIYAIYLERICYLFETDIATASPAALDDIPALTVAQYRDIDEHLLEIMKSVQVSPRAHVR